MNLENVHYNAFISYRHCEPDMFVAKNLHKTLEAFKLPRNLRNEHPELPIKIERVFRDQEELPLVTNLAEPITEALENSDFLIVICTPRLKESMWCQKEIETFISLHGRDRVLAVLAEGEPEDSYPPQLLVDEDGNPIEPLGADFRGKSHREILRKMKTEALRLIAPMFFLNFDDLRQRHREQKARKTISICTIIIVLLLAIGIYSTSMALLIKKQADDIEKQNQRITAQNSEIAEQNLEINNQNLEIKARTHDIAVKYALSVAEDSADVISTGDKLAAIKMLREVLPDDKNDELRPYTPECERALANCLGIYYTGQTYIPYQCIKTDGEIADFGLSEDGKYMFYGEENQDLILIDTDSFKEIFRTKGLETISSYTAVLSGHKFYFSDNSGTLHRYDIDTGTEKIVSEKSGVVRTIKGTDYIYTSGRATTSVIDTNTEEIILELRTFIDAKSYDDPGSIYVDDNNIYVDITPALRADNLDGFFRIYDLHTGELKDELRLGTNFSVTSVTTDDNLVYMAVVDRSDYTNSYDYLMCYDMNAKKVLYKTKGSNKILKNLAVVDHDGQKYLFAIDDSQPFTFNIETGELMYSGSYESYVVDSIQMTNGYEALLMKNGEMSVYGVFNGFEMDASYFVYPFNERVSQCYNGKDLFAFHSYSSNIIGLYRQANPNKLVKLATEPDYHKFTFDEAETNIPSANCTIRRTTDTFGIFDYNGNCIADLRNTTGYDEATNSLIYENYGDYYAIPLYSYEDLLKAADEYLADNQQ